MSRSPIQSVFDSAFDNFSAASSLSHVQMKAASSILKCKTKDMGCNVSSCSECGFVDTHYNSCRNRNCPNCQAVLKEKWIDARRAEVIDAPYFHVVFTIPHELNSLIYCNQNLLYSLLHKAAAQTLLELSGDPKYLGATPGIIQVLHTWGQNLSYHPHLHCIISGAGLTKDMKLKKSKTSFFIPIRVLRDKFKGKFLALLKKLFLKDSLTFAGDCASLAFSGDFSSFCDSLYTKDWCPFIKETFNGFGNAIEYLGRYAHRIAISNARILSVSDTKVTFNAKDYRTGETRAVELSNTEFIRRFLMHVLPDGFQKIRYYGFLNNRCRSKNLKLIFRIQGHQQFKARFACMNTSDILRLVWGINIHTCPCCGCADSMHHMYRLYPLRC